MKCISWYFSGANLAPYLVTYVAHVWCTCFNLVQLSLAERPYVTKLVSLMNLNIKVLLFTHSNTFRSSEIKKKNRIDNKGNPYRIPVAVVIG